jgi:hypothetical protein
VIKITVKSVLEHTNRVISRKGPFALRAADRNQAGHDPLRSLTTVGFGAAEVEQDEEPMAERNGPTRTRERQ